MANAKPKRVDAFVPFGTLDGHKIYVKVRAIVTGWKRDGSPRLIDPGMAMRAQLRGRFPKAGTVPAFVGNGAGSFKPVRATIGV